MLQIRMITLGQLQSLLDHLTELRLELFVVVVNRLYFRKDLTSAELIDFMCKRVGCQVRLQA